MDYSQFLNMIPEATLMLALIIVFCADFALSKSPRKTYVLSILTGALLLCQLVPCCNSLRWPLCIICHR